MSLSRWIHGRRVARWIAAAEADLARMPLPEAVAERAAPVGPVRRETALRRLHVVAGEILVERRAKDLCLLRAVALLSEARRLGFDARVACGVRKRGGAVEAHAWLVTDGRPVLDAPSTVAEYEVLTILPRGGAPA